MKKIMIIGFIGSVVSIITTIDFFILNPIGRFLDKFRGIFLSYISVLPQPYREVINMYDIHGLKHNLHYLNSIKHKVAQMPLIEQAQYADKVCIHHVKDETEYLLLHESDMPIEQAINATAIGNLAYIILNTKNLETKAKAQTIRENYLDYLACFS